jgi:hypothetical protein
MPRLTAKRSTIFISAGRDTKVYHSLLDVPAPSLRRIKRIARTGDLATILIADKRGQKELECALQRDSDLAHSAWGQAIRSHRAQRSTQNSPVWLRNCCRWLEYLVPLAIAGGLWALLQIRF